MIVLQPVHYVPQEFVIKNGIIDFGWIDVPFKTNFTISFTLSSEKMYIKSDSPWLVIPSEISGEVGQLINVSVMLVVPADAKPMDYILHIYVSTGPVGSVTPQIAYQIRFSVKGISLASCNPRPDSVFIAIYNSYPDKADIRAKVYLDGILLRELTGTAGPRSYVFRNVSGSFEGRHNITVVAYSSTGYYTRYVYLGDILPIDIRPSVKVSTNGEGVLIEISISNYGRDASVIVNARGWSDERNDSFSQVISVPRGATVNVTIELRLSFPAFIKVSIIAVKAFSWEYRIPSQEETSATVAVLPIKQILVIGPIVAAALLALRAIRKPRGKFKTEWIIILGLSGPILAIRDKEPVYPPGQALAILSLPQADFHGDGVIISDRVMAIRSTENLKVYVVGVGDINKALDIARKIRNIMTARGADIVSEISPDDPIVEQIIELI